MIRIKFGKPSRYLHILRALVAALLLAALLGLATPIPRVYAADITVNSTDDTTVAGDGNCTLREAINNAEANADTTGTDCTFDVAAADAISFTVTDTITLGSALTTITESLTISGLGSGSLTINGANSFAVFTMNGGTVSISGLTILNGSNASSGGGIRQEIGTTSLTISNVVVRNNVSAAGVNGGGVSIEGGDTTIQNSTIGGNTAGAGGGFGGGIYTSTDGTVSISNSTITGNTAEAGGAGIFAETGTLNISDSTVSLGTVSGGFGGGIWADAAATVTITSSTVSANSAQTGGAGIFVDNTASVTINSSVVI